MRRQAPTAAPVKPRWWAAAGALICWLAIYLPDAGRGFIKDDFAWLLAAPLSADPWSAAWTASTGFFRPLVSLSFTFNHVLFDLDPHGYGLTNLALALAAAAAIFALARSWGIGQRAALVASGVWLFTPHGMDMAVIWISGRSALLLVLFAVLTCWAAAKGRLAFAASCLAAALLSKDEAVIAPALALFSMAAAGYGRDRMRVAAWIALSVVLLAAYFWMRAASGALTPWSAPEEYRPALDPALLAWNAAQYADRLFTFPLAIAIAIWLATGAKRPRGLNRRHLVLGLLWSAVALVPTIALPVRSSLYTLLPLIGSALALAAAADAMLREAGARRQLVAAIVLLAVAAAAIPIHRSRQREWSGAARLSARITRDVQSVLKDVPAGATVSVQDRAQQPNLESTFGNLLPEMLQVVTGRRFELVHAPAPGPSILLAPVPR